MSSLRFLTAGESHGPRLTAILEGLPAGLALDLSRGEAHPDKGEFLDLVKLPFSELLAMVRRGEISDGKTAIAVLQAAHILAGE